MDWGQKYRPRALEEMVLSSVMRSKLQQVINRKGGISLLFWGRPGSGKTTTAKLINPENTVFINCSTNNSIDTIRWIEHEFISGVVTGGRRLILLDEADNLTPDAQAAIRAVSEELSLHNDFVLTANDPNKLSEAVRSRFLPVNFDMAYSEELIESLIKRLITIAKSEGHSKIDGELVEPIVKANFPDLRRMTKTLQFELMNLN